MFVRLIVSAVAAGSLALVGAVSPALADVPDAASVGATAPVGPTPVGPGNDEITRLIVAYEPGVSPIEAPGQATGSDAVQAVDLEPGRKISEGMRTVELSAPLSADAAQQVANQLTADPRVQWAEPDKRVMPVLDTVPESATSPNDPKYTNGSMWGLNGTYGIKAPTAWATTTGSSSVVVAVIDTGITTHSELPVGSQVPGYDFIADVLVANDGDGRDSDPSDPGDWITAGEDASGYFADCGVSDSSWHGTHVAGTIGAATDNSVGIAGIAPGIKVEPIRALGKCGGFTSDIVAAITWASGGSVSGVGANANPASVINMSLGGGGACSASWQTAIDGAVGRGTTVVVAAGNSDVDAEFTSPASCGNVVTVGAIGSDGKRASFSNYGPNVDLAAPGVGIWSALNSGTTIPAAETYASYGGTSMATPHVVGVAALAKSANSSLTPAQIETLLEATGNVTPFAGGTCDPSKACGSGIVNAGAAVAAALGTSAPAPAPPAAPPAAPPTAAPDTSGGGSSDGESAVATPPATSTICVTFTVKYKGTKGSAIQCTSGSSLSAAQIKAGKKAAKASAKKAWKAKHKHKH